MGELQKSRTLLDRVLSAQSYYVLLIGLIPGFTLVFGSILLGVGLFKVSGKPFAPIEREVGYLAALNWSLAYAVLFPAALFLMTESLQGIADALDALHKKGMVRDKDMKVVQGTAITDSWIQGIPARSFFLLLFGMIIPAFYAFGEWLPNNLLRLLHRGPTADYPDYDWGLAGIMHVPEWSFIHRLLNAGFDLLAFSTEGLLIASSFVFFLLLLDLGRALPGTQRTRRGRTYPLLLVPDLRSEDQRRGFEVFSDPLQKALGAALFMYLILYCVRLEGVYMKSSDYPSLAAFVQTDILSGAEAAADTANGEKAKPEFVVNHSFSASTLKHLFSTGDETVRGILAWFMAILIFAFSLIVLLMTVQRAAQCAKDNAAQYSEPLFGDIAAEREKGTTMVVWPLGYLKLSTLLAIMGVAACTLHFYRIGLFVAGFVVTWLMINLIRSIVKPPNAAGRRAAGASQ